MHDQPQPTPGARRALLPEAIPSDAERLQHQADKPLRLARPQRPPPAGGLFDDDARNQLALF
jgi:hypothetical protein